MKNIKQKIKAGISIGDLNGVGIEIIIKTFQDHRMMDFCTPIIFGSSKVITHHKKILEEECHLTTIKNIAKAAPKKINLINLWDEDLDLNIGKASTDLAKYSFNSLKKAAEALNNNDIDLLITAPINKNMIQKEIKDFIGHTEFLEASFEGEALMVMVSEFMKVAFITGHIPLSQVKESITTKKIINKTMILNESLKKDFGCIKPKIAVLGINPHAGENGMLGKEENDIIIPAIKKLNEKGIMAFGPYPADSFFNLDKLKKFDGVMAMYHDQGLIPFKTLSFSDGVNYTAGLNIIRTSPVHGTGYDIAGKNQANAQSFRQSIFLACDIFKKRKDFSKLNKDSSF